MRILGLSSFVPEQICDFVRFKGYQGSKSISHYCGYAADYISQVLEDNSFDGAVYPKSCDSARVISSYLEGNDKFIFQIHVPAVQNKAAEDVFAYSVSMYKEAVEKHYGITIKEDNIRQRIGMIRERNAKISAIYEDIEKYSYHDYLKMLQTVQDFPLDEQAACIDRCSLGSADSDKKVYLIGSTVTNISVAESIEKSGMIIAGDNIGQSKRMFTSGRRKLTGDVYRDTAADILSAAVSPTQDCFRDILKEDMDEVKKKNIDGVIFLTQRYCEPYDYLFSVYKKAFAEMNIPVLRLTTSGSAGIEEHKLSLEAFYEML